MISIETRILSPTAINTYLSCPHKFYLRYIKKLPTRPSIHLIRGQLIHRTLHEFNKGCQNGHVSLNAEEVNEALLATFNQLWGDATRELATLGLSRQMLADFHDDSEAMLINFGNWFCRQAVPPVVSAAELKLFSSGLRLMGIVDAVRIAGNDVVLTDYKTSKDFSITDDIIRQAVLYAMLYQDRYGEPPVAVSIHFLKDPGDPTPVFIDEPLMEYGKILLALVHEKTRSRELYSYPCTCGGYCERDFITTTP